MAKNFSVAGPGTGIDVPRETERPETRNEQMDRQERDIDYANLTGLPYRAILGEGEPATVVESEVDTSGPAKQRIYKPRSEDAVGPTNTLKGR